MKIERLAALANILALIPGGYCAYGTWVLLHPQPAAAQGQTPATSLSGVLYSLFAAIVLVVLAAVLNVAATRRHGVPQQVEISPIQAVASAAIKKAPTSPIDVDAFFQTSYSGQLQTETERNVRAMIESRPREEREDFVIRFIARGVVSFVHERTWLTIYKSQILALMELNRKILRREEVRSYYDSAAKEFPEHYAGYSFDQWFSYLKDVPLILEHPGDTVEITVGGKDFLKYMVHCGYTADARKF